MKFFSFSTGSHGCIVTFQPLNNRRGALFQHAHTSGRFWSLSHVIFFLFFVLDKTLFSFSLFGGEPMSRHTAQKGVLSPKVSHFYFSPSHVVIWFQIRLLFHLIQNNVSAIRLQTKQKNVLFFSFLEKKICFPMWIDKEKIFLTVTSACLTHLSGFKISIRL